ncbi:thiamine pyrophosphate-dependent enzyme, partial [Lonsdalea populi]
DRTVVCFSGDGSLMMNIQELATLAEQRLNVKIVLMNNQALGMVHQQQDLFYEQRYVASDYSYQANFLAIATGFGLATCDLNAAEDPQAALRKILNQPGPALIHALIDVNEKVYPMVPPGAANIEMIGD